MAQAADDVYNCVVTDGHFNCLGALFSFILPVGVCCAFHAPFARKLVRRREEEEEEISQDVNEEDHGNQEQITVDAGKYYINSKRENNFLIFFWAYSINGRNSFFPLNNCGIMVLLMKKVTLFPHSFMNLGSGRFNLTFFPS